jgi:hypothetical protein
VMICWEVSKLCILVEQTAKQDKFKTPKGKYAEVIKSVTFSIKSVIHFDSTQTSLYRHLVSENSLLEKKDIFSLK